MSLYLRSRRILVDFNLTLGIWGFIQGSRSDKLSDPAHHMPNLDPARKKYVWFPSSKSSWLDYGVQLYSYDTSETAVFINLRRDSNGALRCGDSSLLVPRSLAAISAKGRILSAKTLKIKPTPTCHIEIFWLKSPKFWSSAAEHYKELLKSLMA